MDTINLYVVKFWSLCRYHYKVCHVLTLFETCRTNIALLWRSSSETMWVLWVEIPGATYTHTHSYSGNTWREERSGRNGVERMVLLSVTLPPWSVSRILHGQCMAAGSYSGTHEDDGKIAKTRDVKNGRRKPALSDSRAALVATKRGSDKR